MRKPTRNELRCFCSRAPLLALYGLNKAGEGYLHVKVYKSNRIFAEMILKGGDVVLRCRECLRWHRVVMVGQRAPELRPMIDPTGSE